MLPLLLAAQTSLLFSQEVPKPFDRLTFHAAPKVLASGAVTADWPRFLGPTDDCHTPEAPLLKAFPPEGPAIVWEVARGNGHPTPTVAGDYLVHIHEIRGEEIVECLHPETGQRYWQFSQPVTLKSNFGVRDAPRCSPVIDTASGLVFSLGVNSHLQATELATGKAVWSTNLDRDLGPAPFFFGRGSAPLVLGDLLVLNAGAPGACVVAFDKLTGQVKWKTPHEWNASYASPVAGEVNGQSRVFVFAGGNVDPPHGGLLSVNPADGKIDDAVPWRSFEWASVNAASPVLAGPNRVFISEHYGRGGAMIEFDSSFKASFAWKAPAFECRFQTPVYHEGLLFGFDDAGTLLCYDAATGQEKWTEGFTGLTVPFNGRELRVNLSKANLLHADGAFLALSESGTLLWLDLSASGAKVLSIAQLFYAPETWSLPALSKGLLYVVQSQQEQRLICYDLRGR